MVVSGAHYQTLIHQGPGTLNQALLLVEENIWKMNTSMTPRPVVSPLALVGVNHTNLSVSDINIHLG